MNRSATDYDTIIVGGGPAGLSAALWLARYRRRVCVLDAGQPRNAPTWAVHGFPGLPDSPPYELRRQLTRQALHAGAEWEACHVESITGEKNAFRVLVTTGISYNARRVLLAYGRQDVVPDIPGLGELYGLSVFHCADCDGPSMTGERLGVIGWDRRAAQLALFLLTWTDRVTLLTHGHTPKLSQEAFGALERNGIAIRAEVISRLTGRGDQVAAVELEGTEPFPLDGIFFHLGSHPSSDLADQLDCRRDADGNLLVDNAHETSVPGVFAAGDLIGPPYLAISAAAEGVKTALSLHRSLLPPDREI